MNPLNRLARSACDSLVNVRPQAFLDSLRRNHYELVAREFNRAYLFDWRGAQIPRHLEQFEDLAALFELSPMSRGIIRQDFDEAAALFKAIRGLPRARGVEIGRFIGGSTLLLAVAVGPEGKLTSIDSEPQDDKTLNSVLQQAGLRSRVDLMAGDPGPAAWKEALDFVFIDGDRSYKGAKRDHNLWGNRVKEAGLIIHHDMANSRRFATQWNDLARLRAEILKKQTAALELVREAGSLSIFRKRNALWTDL